MLMGFTCKAQSYLAREITVNATDTQRLGDLLDGISTRWGFYFAYNSDVVDADKQVNTPYYRGTLVGFLEQVLGTGYVFKESPGYVIIRYAPRLMDLTVHVEQRRGRPLVVEGQVTDAGNRIGISQASIYERNVLVSTLSGPTGNFRLSFRRPNETIWLTVSKENYRDTTIALLLPVEVGSKAMARRYWFFPENDGNGLEGTAFGRFFTSSKQRIQRINLGGFFAYSPYQISLTPGVSSQGLFNSQLVNSVSLNIIGGHTAGVNGVEVGGIFNVNQQNVGYFQTAGLFNLVGGSMRGVQVAGAVNVVVQRVSGVQVAGVTSWGGNVSGMQLSGIFNIAENTHGMQLAGLMNRSRGEAGTQIAGLFNKAGNVKGVQLGALVNVADSSDYPIGLVNLVKNGSKSLSAGVDESSLVQLTFRSGGRVLYGLIGVGHYLNGNPMAYALDAGLGVHIMRAGPFDVDAEAVRRVSTGFRRHSQHKLSFRLLPQVGFGHHWGIVGGPSLNVTFPDSGNDAPRIWGMGIYGGVQYHW